MSNPAKIVMYQMIFKRFILSIFLSCFKCNKIFATNLQPRILFLTEFYYNLCIVQLLKPDMAMKRMIVLLSFLLLLCVVLVNLNLKTRCDLDNVGLLTFDGVEALASPESPDFSPCVLAEGYCFMDGVRIRGISIKRP